jgi:hypothetical protein
VLPVAGPGCGANEGHFAGKTETQEIAPAASPATSEAPAEGSAGNVPEGLPRRIIYNAQVTLVVESLTTIGAEITKLVKDEGGYVAETNTYLHAQARRSGTWKVRIPAARFEAFLAAIARMGELQQTHIDSQDVSQEYYDLEARISSKQEEEKRLLKHLADSTGKLEDILAVERELSRVRTEIEQMQGRHRYLTNQTDFSTVTISVSELRDYTPPVSPTLATEVSRTFRSSLEALLKFGRGTLLLAVALAPWIPLLALVFLAIWVLVRRGRTSR